MTQVFLRRGLSGVHELSLCEGVLQVLRDNAGRQGYRRVRTIWLEVGALSCVDMEALRFSFGVVARGTLADEAMLEIIEVPGAAWCLRCARTVKVAQRFDACPDCGAHPLQVTAGTEMRVRELEVE